MTTWEYTDETIAFVDGPATAFDSKGTLYVCLTQAGLKTEGEPPPSYVTANGIGDVSRAETEAWALYNAELIEFLQNSRASRVEWRVRPYLEHNARILKAKGKPPRIEVDIWIRSRLSVTERHGENANVA